MNKSQSRLLSVDMMLGFTLFLMLFVNDLYINSVPKWLLHTEAYDDGMGLADWVFPGFLFMVGISIPFAMANRLKIGDSISKLINHILFRSGSLILISLMIFNRSRLNEVYVGMSKFTWAILLYTAIFLVWNNYPKGNNRETLYKILRGIGFCMLAYLLFAFRSGGSEDLTWMVRGWWGILGLIGWGYLVAALGSLWFRDNVLKCALLSVFFLILNILHSSTMLSFLSFLQPVFNVIIEGNIPFIVLSGVLVGLLIKKYKCTPTVLIHYILLLSGVSLVLGFFLRNWFIISKIYATPSWGLICNGISLAMFSGFYYLMDVKQYVKGLHLFQQAGQNSLTTYILPDVVYIIIWTYGLPVFFYKYLDSPLWCIVGSLAWAYAMLWLALAFKRFHVQLKL